MGSRKGKPNKLTAAVKDRVEQAFNSVNGKGNAGLIALASDHPAIFYNLVAKCIPAAVALTVDHHGLDLGLAMRQGKERLKLKDVTPVTVIEHEPQQPIVIVEPDTAPPGKVERDNVSGETKAGAGVPGKAFKRLRRQKKKAGGGAGVPPKA